LQQTLHRFRLGWKQSQLAPKQRPGPLPGLIGKVALIPIKVITRNKKYEQQHQSLTSRISSTTLHLMFFDSKTARLSH
jgi:hypothetical protein